MSGPLYEKMHQRAVVSTLPGLLRMQLKQCFALVIAAGFASAARKVVGFAMGNRETGEFWVIAVLPEFEGRGIGSKLLNLAESWLWATGWKEIWLWTSLDTQLRAYSFYKKHGWFDAEVRTNQRIMKKSNLPLS
ncbi:MAG TPA: GNAT family N-acetyltransferase [Chthoniobacterales bacterium]|nr:GNAT family N-acetyltransferase [Chthoniobacterales bacterium]